MVKSNFKDKIKKETLHINSILSIQILIWIFVLIGCNGCGVGKKVSKPIESSSSPKNITEISAQKSDPVLSSQGVPDLNWKSDAQIPITRSFMGKNVTFKINPDQPGGEDIKVVYQDTLFGVSTHRRWVFNQITQLSPTVLLYSEFPKEVDKDFYYSRQPLKLEFMDTTFQTIKTIDIWKDRPYQEVGDKRLTYYHFDAEGMEMAIDTTLIPDEYSLFTDVRSEGRHVIVNYRLRSMKDGLIIKFKNTSRIYNLSGNLQYEIKDYPNMGGAVVSNNGKYMMFKFGGGIRSANNPMPKTYRTGWALMTLSDQKIVYKEFTDDGILAFNRLWMDISGLLKNTYSSPSDNLHYDYHIYFDDENQLLYKKLWLQKEWDDTKLAREKLINNRIKYFQKFEFATINIE